jgi:signal transduction histidine kinase
MIEWDQGRILAVDDNRVNRLVLEKRLSQEGYEVDVASDGEEALRLLGLGLGEEEDEERLPGGEYDAVVLDIMMPRIDGITVLGKIREAKSSNELPVIMATAKDQTEDIVEALERGCNDYVTKPIDMAVLLARLRTQISLRRTYLALQEAQQALIDAAKMEAVGYLAAGVAHEVRNPLAQIQMGVEALGASKAVRSDARLEPMIKIVEEAVEKADSIIRRLMKVSQEGRLELRAGSMNELVKKAAEREAEAAEAAGVAVALDLDESISSVPLARGEMGRVLSNILSNAVEATPRGGAVTVRTFESGHEGGDLAKGSRSGMRLRREDQVVVVEVTDSGPGIPEGKLGAIFDPFYTTKAPGEGTGLGLSVARKLVDLHHGLISAENRDEGGGARVSVFLPTSASVRTSV